MTQLADSLREGVQTCQKVLSGELLPHQVDAWRLWDIVSKASDKLSGAEEHLLYATLLRLIVAIVRLQCRWLRYEADELYVDSDLAKEKISLLSTRTLTSLFVKSFHPLAEIEQMTLKALELGKRHWEELPGKGTWEYAPPEQYLTYGPGTQAESQVVQEVEFRKVLEDLLQEFQAQGSEVPYEAFISRQGSAGFVEIVARSYLVSFLVSQGMLDLKADGTGLKLSKAVAPVGQTQSVAVILRRKRGRVSC